MIRKILARFSTMRHVHCSGFGGVDVLNFKTSPIPALKKDEVLIKVQATALNRADTLQRQGKYPPPPGASDIIGLEAAGYLLDQNGNQTSKRVVALLSGGGYSEYVAVNKDHILEIPDQMSFSDAAGLAETWLTAYQLLKKVGCSKPGENVLIYAGASGVGTAAIQLCSLFNTNAIVSVSSPEKLQFCKNLGAQGGIIYKDNLKQKEQILELTKRKGADIVLDCIGASNVDLTLSVLNYDARWVLYGLMGGAKVPNFNLASLVGKRGSLICSTLRSRTDCYKRDLVRDFQFQAMPLFRNNTFKTIIDKVYNVNLNDDKDVEKVREAHQYMEKNQNIGKIVLNFV
ncbi:NAD(P)H quinone oxidoreductase, PIG3 family protein, putative (macronuclear) [Tetrahymena thermophila SB210]|uniref:NAD(P)H quinone oxidoreductase, PIG3 family protein, putative n=1 Tax=Tetrahymena thermophila (strain SB210) TaxID=312017 RepID=I7ML71_TETTS|nr:NAD(P)H quinone oxidoreductase, PIG3 family protein, putative [Tetrahymena thermophila SB210]EAS01292.2 NAD(P)H quinone oxidoreductase, PIG3 family protein, putative [Tetrahymena thermophila SB210]|eukprot:XP_001021537.2 NAD(P)H quinone oxidoreductase, PIG3 family protein, putative [Tetrahymena thermophila SB210]